MSSLPLPDAAPTSGGPGEPEEQPVHGLKAGSSGELTPAQRARLGLDTFGADAPAEPAPREVQVQQPPANGNGAHSTGGDSESFEFAAMDPRLAAAARESAPRLAPVSGEPQLAPAQPSALRPATPAAAAREAAKADAAGSDAGLRRRAEAQTVSERDGIPEVQRDRSTFGYGVGWTALAIGYTVMISLANLTASPDAGPSPGTFVPAMVSIVLAWIIVAIGQRWKQWGLLMIIPAVVLLLGPYFYTDWRIGQLESSTRGFLSPAGSTVPIDIDPSNIISATVDTEQGCFALLKTRSNGDVRVDVVTYAPATAQQQATMALAPRFARRVPAGGTRSTQRTFALPGGSLPVNAIALGSAPIDCANSVAP